VDKTSDRLLSGADLAKRLGVNPGLSVEIELNLISHNGVREKTQNNGLGSMSQSWKGMHLYYLQLCLHCLQMTKKALLKEALVMK
jgi:hypothetical protein